MNGTIVALPLTWLLGGLTLYCTGAYLLLFRMFVLWRKEKKDIYDTIYRVKNNDIKHLKDRLDSFEARLPK